MEIIKHKCRICQKVTNQANLNANNEFKLPAGMALLQCSQCGVMGVEVIHKLSTDQKSDAN